MHHNGAKMLRAETEFLAHIELQPVGETECLFASGCGNEGLENSPGFQFTVKTEFIADELAESAGFKTSGECPDETGQGLQQGGLGDYSGEVVFGVSCGWSRGGG